jgi:Ca2+-binding RTX toxin-like protein
VESFYVFGGTGDDRLTTAGGNDGLFGGDGNDTLNGGDGTDLFSGGEGDDVFLGVGIGDVVDGGPGSDRVRVDLGDDTTGRTINLFTGAGAGASWTEVEEITGTFGLGDDDVTVGAQLKSLYGGGGNDRLTLDYSAALPGGLSLTRVSLYPNISNITERAYGSDGQIFEFQLSGFESYDISGTLGDDIINMDVGNGADQGNALFGLAGNDTLIGSEGDTLDGGAGDDVFSGVDAVMSIVGGAGHDRVTFNFDDDTTGGVTNTLTGEGIYWSGIEEITGRFGDGDDDVTVGAQREYLDGGGGTDKLTVDYSRPGPDGVAIERIRLTLDDNRNDTLYIDGTGT